MDAPSMLAYYLLLVLSLMQHLLYMTGMKTLSVVLDLCVHLQCTYFVAHLHRDVQAGCSSEIQLPSYQKWNLRYPVLYTDCRIGEGHVSTAYPAHSIRNQNTPMKWRVTENLNFNQIKFFPILQNLPKSPRIDVRHFSLFLSSTLSGIVETQNFANNFLYYVAYCQGPKAWPYMGLGRGS